MIKEAPSITAAGCEYEKQSIQGGEVASVADEVEEVFCMLRKAWKGWNLKSRLKGVFMNCSGKEKYFKQPGAGTVAQESCG